MAFKYITDSKYLEEIKDSKELGIDLESENNMHHYGTHLSLIQVSDGTRNWIIDALKVKDMSAMVKIFEDPLVNKVFHGISFDFRLLYYHYNCIVKNVFDTQIAAQLIGKRRISLADLLHEYFNVTKQEKFQKADWSMRPLSKEMLEYATKDSQYLLKLRNILTESLKKLGRLDWAEEEFKALEEGDYSYKEFTFWDMKNLKLLTDKQRYALNSLFDLREIIAKKVDRPVHFIINNRMLLSIAERPPRYNDWLKMRGVHPIVRREAKLFYEAAANLSGKKLPMPKKERKKLSAEQKEQMDAWEEKRNKVGHNLDIEPFLIMSKDQMLSSVLDGNFNSMREWQKRLMGF